MLRAFQRGDNIFRWIFSYKAICALPNVQRVIVETEAQREAVRKKAEEERRREEARRRAEEEKRKAEKERLRQSEKKLPPIGTKIFIRSSGVTYTILDFEKDGDKINVVVEDKICGKLRLDWLFLIRRGEVAFP